MKRMIGIGLCCLMLTAAVAQTEPLRIYTDKECYVVGEELWIKVCIDSSNPANYHSKVAYVEVTDSKQIHGQGKIALTNGVGWGRIQLPQTMHSGVYQLAAYTRSMLGEEMEIIPRKQIAVLNSRQQHREDALVANAPTLQPAKEGTTTDETSQVLSTNKQVYAPRERVQLSWSAGIAACKELTLSVVRKDCEASWEEVKSTTRQQGSAAHRKRLPEYEGHIVTARIIGEAAENGMQAELSCVGKNIHLFDGKRKADGTFEFYTHGVNGRQDIVLSLQGNEGGSGRLEPVSPFIGLLPDTLPTLYCRYDKQEMEHRSLAAQLEERHPRGQEIPEEISTLLEGKKPAVSYNLDEYVRFGTVRETLVEFVLGTGIGKRGNETEIRVLDESGKNYNANKALVLLDGVPIDNHEDALNYNARHLQYIHQYRGNYVFSGRLYGSVLLLLTYRGDFSGMRTDKHMQMFGYEFPQERPRFAMPSYETATDGIPRKPDFRHTLCWMPEVDGSETGTIFYTSDMKGTYVVTLRGISDTGEPVMERCEFEVK